MSETTPLLTTKPRNHFYTVVLTLCTIVIFLGVWQIPTAIPEPATPSKLDLRVYTNNIRYDNRHPDVGEQLWKYRKKYVAGSIGFNTINEANVVCLQEVLHNQLRGILHYLNDPNESVEDDLYDEVYDGNATDLTESEYYESGVFEESLSSNTSEWTYYGIGRTDGFKAGEYSPILFRNQEWAIVENKTFWLSDTPEVPSVGWDAALERIVTMVTLQSKLQPDIILNIFNTHFDHKGVKARRKSAKLIVDKMDNYNEYPSFLCGDFNTEPTDEPYSVLTKSGFKDSRILLPKTFGFDTTFSGFDGLSNSIIDYIWSPAFTTPYDADDSTSSWSIKIKRFAILTNLYNYFMSDHRPVSADFEITHFPSIQK